MKKIYTIAAALLASVSAMAQSSDKLVINDFAITAGESQVVTLDLVTDNINSYKAFQCDLEFPQGLSIPMEYNEDEMEDVLAISLTQGATTTSRHTLQGAVQKDGKLRILCYSSKNSDFKKNSIVDMKIAAAADMAAGDYDLNIHNALLATSGDPKEGASVALYTVKVSVASSTGINEMEANGAKAVSYNLAGQRVNENAKGIIIANGKKIRK